MFYFGIFSTYIPYLIMALLYGLYYVSSLFMGYHAQVVDETAAINKDKTIAYQISYKSPNEHPSIYKKAFEQTPQAITSSDEIIIVHFTPTKEKTPLFTYPITDSYFSFALYSRPPPASFLI